MFKITEIKDIPVFIDKYISEDKSGRLSNDAHFFCNVVKNLDFTRITDNRNKTLYRATVTDKLPIIDFYLKKSRLDHKYECLYEVELNLPKSIDNELFKASYEDKEFSFSIEHYCDDELIIEIIK